MCVVFVMKTYLVMYFGAVFVSILHITSVSKNGKKTHVLCAGQALASSKDKTHHMQTSLFAMHGMYRKVHKLHPRPSAIAENSILP